MNGQNKVLILIGNYPNDQQESMERFAHMLAGGFAGHGIQVSVWRPVPVLGSPFRSTTQGAAKWLAYVDKWLLFPLILRWRVLWQRLPGKRDVNVRYHICDHSNSPYLRHLPRDQTSITCHDVLAIQGAMGDLSAYCPASRTGKILQKWILGNLARAAKLAAVSQTTLDSLRQLAPAPAQQQREWRVIHNAFNSPFHPIASEEAWNRLSGTPLNPQKPFILHVGSGLPRKNRSMLLRMAAGLGDEWSGAICFAGKAPEPELLSLARDLRLQDRLVAVVRPDHAVLEALYNACEAFVFPSYSEGFGWPVIEAQACGAAVIASNREPMPEVSGGAALHADPDDPESFAEAFRQLRDPVFKRDLIHRGWENGQRFLPAAMIREYGSLIFESEIS